MRNRKDNFEFTNTKGVVYEIVFRKPHKAYGDYVDGLCIDPEEDSPKIYINPYLTKKSELNTCIHEIARAFFWDKSETDIKRFADVCSNFLYQNGWRLQKRNFPSPQRRKKKQ